MSRVLSQLLGKSESEIEKVITKLESLSGYTNEDIRLLTEIRDKSNRQIIRLGLDPNDSTIPEIHAGLQQKLASDTSQLLKAIGADTSKNSDFINEAIIKLVSTKVGNAWAIKKHTAKVLVEKTPPKKVMKYLGYRSVSSMLKLEEISEIYAGIALLESPRWQEAFWRRHAKLNTSDFETRPIELKSMSSARWSFANRTSGAITCILPIGAVAVWPATSASIWSKAPLAVLIFEAVEHIKIYSCCLRLEQINPAFGRKVLELMQPQIFSPVVVANQPLTWDVLHKHYSKGAVEKLPLNFDPHIESEDLHRKSAGEQMAELHPAFSWWAGTSSLAFIAGSKQISMNIADVIHSMISGAQSSHGLRKSLWSDLIDRYLKHQGVENHVLSQLDTTARHNQTVNISALSNRNSSRALIEAEFA